MREIQSLQAHWKESCQQTFDRLSDMANKIQGLGAKHITDYEVVMKLL